MANAPSGSPSTIPCSVCGEVLLASDLYCGACGSLVNACRNCGQSLTAGDRYCPTCGSASDPAHVTSRAPGDASSPWTDIFDRLQKVTLGEFQIIRELGRGGMAAVFLAHDIHLDRKVAIKVMSPVLASDTSMVERFRREAKTGAGLKHPNIAGVHRVLEGEGIYFFVMDFVRGRPLDAILQRHRVLSIGATRALLYQIGSGLAFAHRRRIYHRDVKPANVILSAADGTAVITDFGIAKVAELSNQTQTGAIIGTAAYMAPEQIFAREITGAVDQYALGIMAYEMLTGVPPFSGSSYEVMHAHTAIEPRPLRELRPDCPPDLADAIARALAKDPADRWPSLPHALAAMGATMIADDDPVRDELIHLATPDAPDEARFSTSAPPSPAPPNAVPSAPVAMVAISPPPEIIEVGDRFRLAASPRDMRGTEIRGVAIDWVTSDASVLAVQSDGTVIAVGVGSAEIMATAARARGAMLLTVEPSRVASVHLSIPPGALMAGDRIQLSARVIDKNRRSLAYPVRWGVADPTIARVSADGVLEARSAGIVEVFAESSGVRSFAQVQIAPPAVTAIHLTFQPPQPVVGDRIVATATPVDASRQPLFGRVVAWTVSDVSLVNTISDGVYDAVADGALRLAAVCEGQSTTIDIPIAPAPPAVIHVSPPPSRVLAGATFNLSAVVLDARGVVLSHPRIAWSTSDRRIATISNEGVVATHAPGDVRIIATCEAKSASTALTVHAAPVASVNITGLPAFVLADTTFVLSATITDVRGARVQKPIEWRSSNAQVASIDATGRVRAVASGEARISAVVEGVGDSLVVTVTEAAAPSVVALAEVTTVEPPSATSFFSPPGSQAPAQPGPFPPSKAPTEPAATTPSRRRAAWFAGAGAVGVIAVVVTVVAVRSWGSTETKPDSSKTRVPPPPPQYATGTQPDTARITKTVEKAPPVAEPKGSVGNPQPTTKVAGTTGRGRSTARDTAPPPVSVAVPQPRIETAAPPLAPVVSPPARIDSTPVRNTQPAAPSAEEIRAKGSDALRRSAETLVDALKAKDVARVTQLVGDGRNQSADEVLKAMKEYGFTASLSPLKQAEMTDRAGALEYEVKVHWQTAVGANRDRIATIRVEAERSGDAWNVLRHRVLAWR